MSDAPRTDAVWTANISPENETMGAAPRAVHFFEVSEILRDHARELERESDRLTKQCVRNVEEIGQLRAELREAKSINLELVPNAWTLERFKGLCDIKVPEAAMVSGEQLLELLTDAARLDWLDSNVGLYDIAEYIRGDLLTHNQMSTLSLRDGIDAAMEAANNE